MIIIARASRRRGRGFSGRGPFVGPFIGGWGGGGGWSGGGSSGGGFSGFAAAEAADSAAAAQVRAGDYSLGDSREAGSALQALLDYKPAGWRALKWRGLR